MSSRPGRFRAALATAAATAALAACPSSTRKQVPPPPPPPSGPHQVQVSLADVGLETSSMDPSVDPCVDFFQYACGGWLAANPIPADRARWARFGEIDERNKAALRTILDELSAKPGDDPIERAIGDYYGACMDEAAIAKRGTAGLKPLLDVIDKIKNGETLLTALATLHRYGVSAAWRFRVDADITDSTTNLLILDSGGLGLPDRNYYLEDTFADARVAYREHLVRLLGLAGKGKTATKLADGIMVLERELARLTKTRVDRRDALAMYHPLDAAGLTKLAGLDWAAYWKQLGTTAPAKVNVTTPDYFAALPQLMAKTRPEVWRAYLLVRVLDRSGLALPRAFDDESFKLAAALTGVEEQPARWKRCADAVTRAMPEYLGQPYVARYFGGDSRATATKLVAAIAEVMNQQMDTLGWMSDATKVQARGKLAKIEGLIGYPDEWKSYDYPIARDDFAGDTLRAAAFDVARELAKVGQPYDRREWLMPVYIVNAYYNENANNTALPAGILQPPFFSADRSIAANLGGIGMVVGHELTHGFDDQGARFDANGNMANWWQPADLEQFKARGTCLADQYSTFETLPGKFVDGRLTLGENIADLGGIKHAFLAYRKLRAGAAEVQVAEGHGEDQQFFLAVGQAWCSHDRPAEALRRLTSDPHAPPRWRVNGSLRNLPAFAEAWGCKRGQPMAPAETCTIW